MTREMQEVDYEVETTTLSVGDVPVAVIVYVTKVTKCSKFHQSKSRWITTETREPFAEKKVDL